jgi:threonine dehydrogenase-like Zn-dependent dehydrogenase
VPERAVVRLPDGVTADAAQSTVTIAVCLRALRRAPSIEGARVAVSGPGHLGLILVQLLLHRGADRIVLFGTRDQRLARARAWGIETVNVRTEAWRSRSGSFDLVYETAGTPESFLQAIELAAPGATVCILGVAKAPVHAFAPSVLYEKELSIIGSKGGSGEYEAALELLATGAVEIAPLITHRFPLSEGVAALGVASDRDRLPVRVVIEAP